MALWFIYGFIYMWTISGKIMINHLWQIVVAQWLIMANEWFKNSPFTGELTVHNDELKMGKQ